MYENKWNIDAPDLLPSFKNIKSIHPAVIQASSWSIKESMETSCPYQIK